MDKPVHDAHHRLFQSDRPKVRGGSVSAPQFSHEPGTANGEPWIGWGARSRFGAARCGLSCEAMEALKDRVSKPCEQ